jgi:hypothetical protein
MGELGASRKHLLPSGLPDRRHDALFLFRNCSEGISANARNSRAETELRKHANRRFDQLSGRGDQIDPNVPLADLNALEDAFLPIKQFVNRRLAHSDLRPTERRKFGDRFLDFVRDTF